jgi:hypothetical protein
MGLMPSPGPHRPIPSSRLVAMLLAAAALLAAILTARASFLSNDAAGRWQEALRQEVKSGAAVVEDVRFVYTDEARQAFRYAVTRVREAEFRKAAEALSGGLRDAVLLEADIQKKLGESIVSSSEVASDPRYALPGGGYDMVLRLADARGRSPDFLALDPDATDAKGEAPARKAVALMASTIPVGLAFMLGAIGQAFGHRRRLLLVMGAGALIGAALLALLVELAL